MYSLGHVHLRRPRARRGAARDAGDVHDGDRGALRVAGERDAG